MKTLYFTRHAKSSWKDDVIDHQRPLKKRGEIDAKMVAAAVTSSMPAPDVIITSDAIRAAKTSVYFKEAFAMDASKYVTNAALYDFSGQQVMQVIKNLDNAFDCVMLFGHNHAFTSIVNMLGNTYIENLPTSGFVAIQFNEEHWDAIITGITIKTIFPRDLK